MRTINSIILHCSATAEGKDFKAKDIDKWHKNQGWKGIGYHYVIDLDGTIEIGRNVAEPGAHCQNHNARSIGIVYIGGVDDKGKAKDTRTEAQKKSMYTLVRMLIEMFGISISLVNCHNQFASKACPSFSISQFKSEYQEYWKVNKI